MFKLTLQIHNFRCNFSMLRLNTTLLLNNHLHKRKMGQLCFYAIFWKETNLQVYQWQDAAKIAQNCDPYL